MFAKLLAKLTARPTLVPATVRATGKDAEARLLILALKNGQPIRRIR